MPEAPPPIHPIEAESYRIIESRVDLSAWAPGERAVVARVIHAAADVGYAATMRCAPGAVDAGVAALRSGAPVVVDVEMVAAATRRSDPHCLLADGRVERAAADEPQLTISAAAMRVAARRWPTGAIVVVGNAPTALFEVLRLIEGGSFAPALVIGMPVGFVGAAESKEALRASGWRSISNVGERGGSAVAAAALNALARLAAEPTSTTFGGSDPSQAPRAPSVGTAAAVTGRSSR
jgi:precorrin-8X/cobalt-precorrin-8 methylmutase